MIGDFSRSVLHWEATASLAVAGFLDVLSCMTGLIVSTIHPPFEFPGTVAFQTMDS
jgi:hypothetical protein